MNQFIRKVNMTDKTKYKSVAIDNDCYKKIEELSTSLIPGIELSRAQVVRNLVNSRASLSANTNQTIVSLFSEHSPFERQQILQDIDKKMCELFDLKQDDFPWFNNADNFSDRWVSVMECLRLVVAKYKYEQYKDEKILN